jgi:ketosteroid isomerase-like protein
MTNQSSNEQQQVMELERSFIEACCQGDIQTLDFILADEFVFTDPNGIHLTKQEWLTDLASGTFRFDSINIEELQVKVREDVAIVQANLRVKARSKKAGYNGVYSAMDVYQKRGGQWQVTLSTANKLEA